MLAAMKAFTHAHARCKPGQFTEPEPSRASWPGSRDTGVSSATIWRVFTGQGLYDEDGVPHDPEDFGRCYRLLALTPEWGPQLSAVAERFPAWVPFVREWPKLKAMYGEALRTNDGKPMYEFMKTLEAETPEVC